MLNITLDIYSGLRNPTFNFSEDEETKILLKEIALNKGAITPLSKEVTRLGYRGINITFKSDYLPQLYGLPSSFSIANGLSAIESKGREIAERLLERTKSMSDGVMNNPNFSPSLIDWTVNQIKDIPIFSHPQNESDATVEDNVMSCPSEQVVFDQSFWNNRDHMQHNNCYNFATNRRTDSFAQPGRASGHMYNNITCEEVKKGAISDGADVAGRCFPETEKPRFLMALVIAPGPGFIDYHWYRQCSDGNWAHKPGQTPARNTDESNHIITDPRTANRGPYTQFCGYMLAPKSMDIF
ncbi:hypothetical protein H7U08_03510 [Bacillus cereus]|uniref:Uncharacterized protein n=1 Tax=Bacillus cereus TaxID=1396 RepID=A0AAW4QRC3_BACCE|nr:hypothetical protein [Bacillus cereus]MBY0035642.1 hypothetical protein [Bacillus cereus]